MFVQGVPQKGKAQKTESILHVVEEEAEVYQMKLNQDKCAYMARNERTGGRNHKKKKTEERGRRQ